MHLLGLVSDAGVHAMLDHLFGLILLAKNLELKISICTHLLMAVRLVRLRVRGLLNPLSHLWQNILWKNRFITGRYWSMDRDNRWDRVKEPILLNRKD